MAQAFRAQAQQVGITDLSFEGRFALLVMSTNVPFFRNSSVF